MKLKKQAHWILVLSLSGPLLAGAADSNQPVAEGGIPHVSGGFGLEERQALSDVSGDYNLKLVFAAKGSGAYIADVKLSIADMKGQKILETISNGPWFFAKLAPGRYKTTAEAAGQSQVQQVTVGSGRLAQLHFYWHMSDEMARDPN